MRSVAALCSLGLSVCLLACAADTQNSPASGGAGGNSAGAGGAGSSGGATAGTGGTTDDGMVKSDLPGPDEWNRDVLPPSDDEAEKQRAACAYKKGALPAETQGKSYPNGKNIPIEHIFILMHENRSFDHYFQKLPEFGQPDVEVAPADFTNPDVNGEAVAPFHITSQHCFVDTSHDWTDIHTQVNNGAMDGFIKTNEGNHELPMGGTLDMLRGVRSMGYYDGDDLPFYYWLANEFSIADHYHCSLQAATWPNRMYLYAASSFGQTNNDLPGTPDNILVDELEARGIDWKVYTTYPGTPGLTMFINQYIKYRVDHFRSLDDYFADAEAGTLPQFAFIDPALAWGGGIGNDEHPPGIARMGENLTATVVDALTKSPQWSTSALFITYDEHGGLYDHVVPPPACPPGDVEPIIEEGQTNAGFDQLGIRVPMMVVSPFSKKHHVSHRVYDHTSLVRFVEAKFYLPAMTNRDANAEAPWDMFDFDNPPHLNPPTITIPNKPSQEVLDACETLFPAVAGW